MEERKNVIIQNKDGTTNEVEKITYLIREDNTGSYLVYSKGEVVGEADDRIIYVSKIISDGNILQLTEITDDEEWKKVQALLKKIANS